MDYTTMSNRCNGKDYESKLSYPPFRRDNVEREKMREADRNMYEAYQKDENRLRGIFMTDLRDFVEGVVGKKLTDEQFGAISSKAWEDGHASGYHEILLIALELADLAKILME
jgi:hypothetical protein